MTVGSSSLQSSSSSTSNSAWPRSPSSSTSSSPTPSSSKNNMTTCSSARTKTHLPITVDDNEPYRPSLPNKHLDDFMSSSSSSYSASTVSTSSSSSSSSSSSASASSPLGFKRSDHHDTHLMDGNYNTTNNNQQMTPNTKRRRRTTSIVMLDSTAIIDGIQNHPQPQSLPLHGTSQRPDDSAIIFAINDDAATSTAADGNMSSTSSPIPRHVSRNDFLHVEERTATQEKANATFGTAADTSTRARIPSTIPMTMTDPCPYHPSGAIIITPQSSAIFVMTDCTDTNNTKSNHSNDENNSGITIYHRQQHNDHDQVGLSVEEHDDEDGVDDERPLLRPSLAHSGEKKEFVGNVYNNGGDGGGRRGLIITGNQVPCPPLFDPKHQGATPSVGTTTTKTNMTMTSSSSWSAPSWRLVRDMFVLQIVVWLSVTAWTQYTSKLTLPPPEVPYLLSSTARNRAIKGMNPAVTTVSESVNNNNTIRNYNIWNNTMSVMKNTRPDGVVQQADEDCIYVPGGGFSGFWFSLGRLQSLKLSYDQQQVDATSNGRQQSQSQSQQPPKDRFVCYSAGCLGVVASLLDRHSMSELYAMARAIQVEWVEGRLHRYQVVEAFVDALLEGMDDNDDNDNNNQSDGWDTIRRRLFIVTTVPTTYGRWDAQMRQPYDVASLKTMLLQTTWIPLAVGSSFTHHGHMDGAFSTLQHPSCRRKVGLAGLLGGGSGGNINGGDNDDDDNRKKGGGISDLWTLWSNTLNVNLRKEDVEHLWQMGLDYGV